MSMLKFPAFDILVCSTRRVRTSRKTKFKCTLQMGGNFLGKVGGNGGLEMRGIVNAKGV